MATMDKRDQWERQIERWQASGLTQKDFCLREGLVYATFCYWVRKSKLQASEADTEFACVPVEVLASAVHFDPDCDIVVRANGIELGFGQAIIQVHGSISLGQLAQLAKLCDQICRETADVPA